MRREVFMQRRAAFMRRDKRNVRLQILAMFGVCAFFYALAHLRPDWNDGLVAVFIILCGAVLVWTARLPNQTKKEGLVCRTCDGGLLNAPGDIAMASGRCPHCGGAAFDE